jgi:hypothetical protein
MRPVIWLTTALERVPVLKHILVLFGKRTPFDNVSLLALFVAFLLAVTGMLDTPRTVASAVHEIEALPAANRTSHTTDTTPGDTTSTPTATSTVVQTPAQGSVTPASTQPQTQPSNSDDYATHCRYEPGEPAPEPQRDAIYAQVYGSMAMHKDGLGGNNTGCLRPAVRVGDEPGLFYSPGFCGSELRSLTIARANGDAVTLLQEPARFAYAAAEAGTLVWASDREDVGTGNIQTVETTTDGVFVFMREQSAHGTVVPPPGAIWCDRFTSENVAYTRVPPALAGFLPSAMRAIDGWVWVFKKGPPTMPEHFLLDSNATGKVVGQAVCTSLTDCAVNLMANSTHLRGVGRVSIDELLGWAPSTH